MSGHVVDETVSSLEFLPEDPRLVETLRRGGIYTSKATRSAGSMSKIKQIY